ncbi:MAG: hypothetical protein ACFB13_04720 [Kiloniellaceae bacterium]
MARRRNPWVGLAWDSWALGLEASSVVGLRSLRIAAGGASGAAEARRMVSEKIEAAVAGQTLVLTGGLGVTAPAAASKTLKHYGRKVRANRRRLQKP